jgi:hypothetical protein
LEAARREDVRELIERSCLNEGLDELRGKEPEDVTVKRVNVTRVNVLSGHQGEASN